MIDKALQNEFENIKYLSEKSIDINSTFNNFNRY